MNKTSMGTNSIYMVAFNLNSLGLAQTLLKAWPNAQIFTTLSEASSMQQCTVIVALSRLLAEKFHQPKAWVFIGALPICVRSIAPHLNQKQLDPAVIHLDEQGKFIQAVVGSHQQQGNQLAQQIAQILGGQSIITTAAENANLWVLDELPLEFGWTLEANRKISKLLSIFLQKRPTALWVDTRDAGVDFLLRTKPSFVHLVSSEELQQIQLGNTDFELLIGVSCKEIQTNIGALLFRPKVLCLGTGCNKGLDAEHFNTAVQQWFTTHGWALSSLLKIASLDLKQHEPAYLSFAQQHQIEFTQYNVAQLQAIDSPNPSTKVQQLVQTDAVAEPSAMLAAENSKLLLPKTKIKTPSGQLTLALACLRSAERSARVDIVGAGPGDPELISLKGKHCLEQADAVLYAGSLIPRTLLNFCKNGCLCKNTASMTLEEQQTWMQSQVCKSARIVRLQSGDTSFYSAIQEQIDWLEEHNVEYQVIPGISSFSAAAALLKTELTAPGLVQTVVLTRAAGKTAMPDSEKLADLAKTGASMCIFLSAKMVLAVQQQLSKHFDPQTPAALLYRVGWPNQKVWQGSLSGLAEAATQMKVSRSLLIVVSKALKHERSRSQLYHPNWEHIFRKKVTAS